MSDERKFDCPAETIWYQHLRDDDGDLVMFDGQVYRRQSDGPDGSPLESFDPANYREVSRIRQHNREFGSYPWDHWHAWAIEDGVAEDLAGLGRALIREADQHNWSTELQKECGWDDSGAAMIRLALEQPDEARKRWEFLMQTDGARGHWSGGDFRPMSDLN